MSIRIFLLRIPMSNAKIQMSNQAQNPKPKKNDPYNQEQSLNVIDFGILAFGFHLAFEL